MGTDGYGAGYGRPARKYGRAGRPSGSDIRRDRPERQEEDEDSEAYLELKAQLTEYYRRGVKISLGGVRMPVSRIARICAVREEGKYMGDYILNEAGELTEVRFDRVSHN